VNAESSENNAAKKTDSLGSGKWHFIDSGYRTGKFNMEYDLGLVEKCRASDESFLRFYRWKPYAISLGYNQSRSSTSLKIDEEACRENNIDIIERPTGGRAVLHSEELTYSVVMKTDKPIRDTYRDISLAILNGLKMLEPENLSLQRLSFTKDTPDIRELIKTGMYNLCFNSQVKNEINHLGRKLVGSAQRKFTEQNSTDIILQHGSVLIGSHHKSIVNYLKASQIQKNEMSFEIENKTTCLGEILGRNVSYKETGDAIFKGFETTYNIRFASINRLADLIAMRAVDHESILN
jgi:lipoate-protein ligase A